jgi:TRAP-type C4-dicarboxylate transport system substrate-binding protein
VILRIRTILLAVLLTLVQGAALAEEGRTLRFATLAPEGSAWMERIDEWAGEVAARSQGRLRLKIYPGGVSGDEAEMLRKIGLGQLQGAAFTGLGIGEIYSPARVLEMPFLLRDYEEIDYVRRRLLAELRAGFRERGFELLGLTEVGINRFYSKAPIRSLADLRARRVWLCTGDPLAEAFFSVSDLSPVVMPITEVFKGLSTGRIDTVYAPPLAAIALQWFTKTRYVTETAMGNSIGALVIANRFFDGLPEDLRTVLRSTGEQAAARMARGSRRENRRSLEVLKDYGLRFVQWREDDRHRLLETRDRAAALLAEQGYIPAELYRRVRAMLEDYRGGRPPGGQR